MATEPGFRNGRNDVGRFSVECQLANHKEVAWAEGGFIPADQVHRTTVSGVVDTGAARLVLPPSAVAVLGLRESGQTVVKFADGRRQPRATVTDVQLEYGGRSGVFSAVVEPGAHRCADRCHGAGRARLPARLHQRRARTPRPQQHHYRGRGRGVRSTQVFEGRWGRARNRSDLQAVRPREISRLLSHARRIK